MKVNILTSLVLSFTGAAWAWPHDNHKWAPPGPDDRRSPCPGLNVLANHGWLPRSGKNIDIDWIRHAVSGGYNYVPHALDDAFLQAVDFNLTTTGNRSTIHLDDLARHDDIEFDGSLSRNDIYFGDNLHFDHKIWEGVAKSLRLYDTLESESDQFVTIEMAAKARAARVAEAKRVNPTFNASAMEMQGSPGTTGIWLATLWSDKYGAVPKSWVKAFFEDERIPYIEGYTPPRVPRTFDNVTAMTEKVLAVKV